MKILIVLFLFILMPSAHAGEKEIRQSLQSKFPSIGKIEHIVKTPYAGLYEIVIDGQLLYTDEKGEYVFEGNVIEAKSRRDLSEERRRILFAIDFNKLPLDLAVKKVKGNGKRKLAIFTDPNCSYCRKLEKELSGVSDVTLYFFMYPIFPGSDEDRAQCALFKESDQGMGRLDVERNRSRESILQHPNRQGAGPGPETPRQRHPESDFCQWNAIPRFFASRQGWKGI